MAERVYIAYEWRKVWLQYAFLILEVPLTIALLVLFGIADGDTYRTKLWQNGYDKGFNSAPNSILYDYANYRPVHYPTVWSPFTTEYNIIISVLGMFILITKSVMYMLHIFIPLLSVFAHGLLIAIYAVSLQRQGAPDLSDPLHPSPGLPWYLSKGCSYAEPHNWTYCMQARSAYACTAAMVGLFAINLLWSVYNCIPTKEETQARLSEREDAIELKTTYYDPSEDKSRSRRSRRAVAPEIPKTPQTSVSMKNLMTPRTKALTVLNGGQGEASAVGRRPNGPMHISTGVGPNRPLAFREQYGDTTSPAE